MMKRFVFMLLIELAFVAVGTAVAHAQAVVIKDTLCSVLAGDCDTVEESTENTVVLTSQQAGHCVVSCKFDLPVGAPLPPGNESAKCDFENTGIRCLTLCGETENWQSVTTPSGQVSLVCHVIQN